MSTCTEGCKCQKLKLTGDIIKPTGDIIKPTKEELEYRERCKKYLPVKKKKRKEKK